MKKSIVGIIIIVFIMGLLSYHYIYNRVIDPFIIDASKATIENPPQELLNTVQGYNFRLVNTSDKAVKLIDIKFEDYKGIKVSDITIESKKINNQEIPSHRIKTGEGWSTNNQGVMVYYHVKILEPKIQNPRSVKIGYSYMGFNHKQIVKLPGIIK